MYASYPELGICLVLKSPKKPTGDIISDSEFVVDALFAYFNDRNRYAKFSGKLPYGLQVEMTNQDLVGFLGEPSLKSGGKLSNISLNWKHIGVEAEFLCKTWEVADAPLAWLCFYDYIQQATLDSQDSEALKPATICGVCGKKATSRCSTCKLVYYCNREHQLLHWKVHERGCKVFTNPGTSKT